MWWEAEVDEPPQELTSMFWSRCGKVVEGDDREGILWAAEDDEALGLPPWFIIIAWYGPHIVEEESVVRGGFWWWWCCSGIERSGRGVRLFPMVMVGGGAMIVSQEISEATILL